MLEPQIAILLKPIDYINPQLVFTADGSQSLYLPQLDEHYHSHHGAMQESIHVYIKSGLEYVVAQGCEEPKIFELGLGTFLNAFLTLAFAENNKKPIYYQGIEKYPIQPEELKKMNYLSYPKLNKYISECHDILDCEWEQRRAISEFFTIKKTYADFLTFENPKESFDLLYFDAFGFRAQSEMWSKQVFEKCFSLLKSGGILVTYAAKGMVRRTMEEVGFEVERIKGAAGKREMMRAHKI